MKITYCAWEMPVGMEPCGWKQVCAYKRQTGREEPSLSTGLFVVPGGLVAQWFGCCCSSGWLDKPTPFPTYILGDH